MPEPPHASSGRWPTPTQKLLLQAVLSQGEGAKVAWEQWRAVADIEHLDPDSYRLLPLLYRNLRSWKVRDPQLNVFKGIYRKTWYRNRVVLNQAADVLGLLQTAGTRTMLLEETSLVLSVYKDHGPRPFTTIDVLVLGHQAGDAMGVLVRAGWKPQGRPSLTSSGGYLQICHGQRFSHENWHTVYLHWRVSLRGTGLVPTANAGRRQSPLPSIRSLPPRPTQPRYSCRFVATEGFGALPLLSSGSRTG